MAKTTFLQGVSRKALLRTIFSISAAFLLLTLSAQDDAPYTQGEKIFKGYCAACHKPDKDMTGPAVQGARERWEGQGDIYAWIKNSGAYLKTGNAYAQKIYDEWNGVAMTPNAITDEEIDAVLYYADNYVSPVAENPDEGGTVDGIAEEEGSSATIWLIIVLLILVIIALSLRGVKTSLRDAEAENQGEQPIGDRSLLDGFKAWAWNNKVLVSLIVIFLLVGGTVDGWYWLKNIGVYGGEDVANYSPEQPIAFNHMLHAGKDNLNIECVYCHSGAEKSKHAGIPSANVCMNCHKGVTEGSTTGEEEIKKIHAAVGWDGKAYTGEEKPIEWVKVHNLPDHVYFNHSQHVTVAGLECQTCHGPVDEEFTVGQQWAPLTMGWCIDCHNTTEVKMAGNGDYYQDLHDRMLSSDNGKEEMKKMLEDGKITVKDLGGWECSKCHY